jgi:hypothetical protein
MGRFGTRTRRFLAVVWLGAAALELALFELAKRTVNSWFLLLGVALLVVPLVATERTFHWLRRAPRKRWKRHDVEAELARTALAQAAKPPDGGRPGGEAPAGKP